MARSRERLARDLLRPLPTREELEALVRHYHHLRSEHERASPESSTRRRLEERLLDVRERFDRSSPTTEDRRRGITPPSFSPTG